MPEASFYCKKKKRFSRKKKKLPKNKPSSIDFALRPRKARQAQSRIKQLERMEIVEPVKSSRIHPHFRFELSEPGSKEVLEVKALNKNYGDKTILKDFTFAVRRKEKVAIIGANGTGKSTLIKALSEEFSGMQSLYQMGTWRKPWLLRAEYRQPHQGQQNQRLRMAVAVLCR